MAVKLEIVKAGELKAENTINVLIYGAPGVGKTFFSSTAPNPLIISVESGDMTINDSSIKATISRNCNTVEKVRESVQYAIENKFKTIVIDSLTRYTEIFLDETIINSGRQKATWEDYGAVSKHIQKMVWALQGKDINTVFICHEKDSEEANGLVKRPSLQGKLAQSVPGICDVVAYLQSTANGERQISVNANPLWYAKHRVPPKYQIKEMLPNDFSILYDKVVNYNKSSVKQKTSA